ncbi:hypothetical protein LP414_29935 [Polaromonas sp. P1(28)-13]|nr:hypothetical protein LP414_29935 [Polaromonas sp. P1(28)-13]
MTGADDDRVEALSHSSLLGVFYSVNCRAARKTRTGRCGGESIAPVDAHFEGQFSRLGPGPSTGDPVFSPNRKWQRRWRSASGPEADSFAGLFFLGFLIK